MTTTESVPQQSARPLDYLPVAMFGSVMGLTGLSVAWRFAHALFGLPASISESIGLIAIVAFVAVASGYAVKWINAPEKVRAEFNHPVAVSLFGTFLISLLLLPLVVAPVSLPVARVLWVAGAVGMVAFAWLVVDRWLKTPQRAEHVVPAWVIPVVGLLDLPLALPSLDLPPMRGVMVFGLAVGLFFAIPLFTLIFSRLLVEPPLPDALQPSLLILVAPFAVGTSTYIVTTGQVDLFADSLFVLTLFMLAVFVGRLRHLLECCPFRVSWWAVSFPLAASAIAALRIAAAHPGWATKAIAILLLALSSAVIAWLLYRTLRGLAQGELRHLSGP